MPSMTERATAKEMPADHAYWTGRLGARRFEAGPPLFRRRSGVYRRKSQLVEHTIAAELATVLADVVPGRRHALLLAATAAVLYRYQGSAETQHIVIGSPVPGPVGPSTVLPVIIEVDAQMSVASLIEASGDAVIQAGEHADVSVEELMDSLGMGEVTNRHPLFPVVLRIGDPREAMPDLRNDVTINLDQGRALTLEYNANVHAEPTVARMGGHILTFLARGLTEPDRSVCAVDYVPAEERDALLAWSRGGEPHPDPVCLHALVEAAVRAHPDREAVVSGSRTLSYAELNGRANQLAHHLRSLGAGPAGRVGLCLPASAELLVGLLGVLKSGATVVPLVPSFPVSRTAMAVADSAMSVVVTDNSLSHRFTEPGLAVVCLDGDAERIGRASTVDTDSGATPDDPVYTLFTSGSTGRPKGAYVSHRTLVNLVRWQRERGLDPAGQRTLQRTSIGFDVSFQEIFSTLGFGGSLVIASDEERDDVSQLPGQIERYGVSRLFLPPVALSQLAVTATLEQRSLRCLREVVVAGEQLQITMPIRRLFHDIECSLDNQYGPTETHVVTAYALIGASTRWPERPPIGRPVGGVNTYVLDPWLQPVPIGVPGQIYVGGVAATGGYLNQSQTAQRLADPFAEGGRLYRTGDRARFLPDGDIEFLGRDDDQVKIRGYRIELGEIEANLVRLPGIRQAAATVHETNTLGKQLAAYVVTDHEIDPMKIRESLLEHLPGHMVPAISAIVRLDRLPLTVTGKVNRRELAAPPRAAASDAGTGVAVGDTEQTVAQIWAAALGLQNVSRDADFVELGGHSLVGIQVIVSLNELYSVSLPLRGLLSGATVAILAAQIDQARLAANGATPTEPGVQRPPGPAPEPAIGGHLQPLDLPNGCRIHCLQPAEARYLYLDVFDHRTYHRGGITYPGTGVVLDIGAHVGLFTLYALAQSPDLRVFAFEPCPPLFEALVRNTEGLVGVRAFSFGLGATRETAQLTYYPSLTGMSSFHPDDDQERALLSAILRNVDGLPEAASGSASSRAGWLADSQVYLSERLAATTFAVQRRTISDVLAELGIDRVDLLKLDVQKSELEVLLGIAPADWDRIGQLVIELHDLDGRRAEVTAMLEAKGYRVTVEQDPLHRGSVVHFVYAVRA
jgi:amino acid adenylation domain-containing protein/FkbM family methyltransferase